MVQIWKLPLKSQREDFEADPPKVERARSFCFAEGWAGIGWGIDSLPDELTDPDVYTAALPEAHPDSVSNALSAHRALFETMQLDDLVWCRAKGDTYWLGRITGPWIYRVAEQFADFDLYQVRRCEWQRIGPGDNVPGPVKNAFTIRGRTISRIKSLSALRESLLLADISNASHASQASSNQTLSLESIGHDHLEDLVGLYLQAELSWFIVPSTAKQSTSFTEFVLRNRRGERAYVQVKSGQRLVDTNPEIPPDVDVFYVFDLWPQPGELLPEKVQRIGLNELETFIAKNRSLLPQYLQRISS